LALSKTSQTEKTRPGKKHVVLRGLVVLGSLAALLLVGVPTGSGTAHAAPGLQYRYGLYIDNGWLCRGWANGAYHCTRHWHRDRAGRLISDNQAWVPTGAGGTTRYITTSATTPRSRGAVRIAVRTTYHPNTVRFATSYSTSYSRPLTGISQWAYTGHPAYAMSDYWGDPNRAWFGSCTWYAQYRHMNEPLMRLGNAAQWAWNAPRYGLRTGTVPVVGATVVFQPGVQGASRLGHVAHVEAVYANGWFLESGMSAYWNGGGWGRVSFLYAHVGYGVSFIY
jgi:surface antigen